MEKSVNREIIIEIQRGKVNVFRTPEAFPLTIIYQFILYLMSLSYQDSLQDEKKHKQPQ